MATTEGFVGTIKVESRGVSRVWFSLTGSRRGADWVKIGQHRAWFTMNLESADRPVHMAKLTVLMEAMRHDLEVRVAHGGAEDFHFRDSGDTFTVSGVRVLRDGLHF